MLCTQCHQAYPTDFIYKYEQTNAHFFSEQIYQAINFEVVTKQQTSGTIRNLLIFSTSRMFGKRLLLQRCCSS